MSPRHKRMPASAVRIGSDSQLTTDGPYKLVINAADGGPGEYHFVFQIVPSSAGK